MISERISSMRDSQALKLGSLDNEHHPEGQRINSDFRRQRKKKTRKELGRDTHYRETQCAKTPSLESLNEKASRQAVRSRASKEVAYKEYRP
jgi:hypothetical protein